MGSPSVCSALHFMLGRHAKLFTLITSAIYVHAPNFLSRFMHSLVYVSIFIKNLSKVWWATESVCSYHLRPEDTTYLMFLQKCCWLFMTFFFTLTHLTWHLCGPNKYKKQGRKLNPPHPRSILFCCFARKYIVCIV